jgi:NAD(P)-dependent dehydrogenase (short-subunit alcohol dehydrogenase family)
MIQSWRSLLKDKSIQSLGVYPGPIDTDMTKGMGMDTASADTTAREIIAGIVQ